jgi:hypothetical protein
MSDLNNEPLMLNRSADIYALEEALNDSFTEVEMLDEIVSYIYVNAATMKDLILKIPNDIKFDYIPNGVGYLRTAYLKFHPGLRDNVYKFTTGSESVILRLELKPF